MLCYNYFGQEQLYLTSKSSHKEDMAEIIMMPRMGDTMTEGVLAKWHKKVGDKVNSGDILAEIHTDLVTIDFESIKRGLCCMWGLTKVKLFQEIVL